MIRRRACLLAALALTGVVGCGRDGDVPRSEQTVDGVTIYLGIVPAALVQGHSTTPGDPKALHGGAEPDAKSHHIMVALFDAGSGARIADASVLASAGGAAGAKPLEPMEVNGLMTYGNFFALGDRGVWHIRVEIALPGRAESIAAQFAYEHQPGM